MSDEQPQEGVENTEEIQEVDAAASTTEEAKNAFGLPDDHPVMKELSKVRKEAAEARVKKVAEAEAAKKWEEHVESQKTELEKLMDKNKTLEEAVRQSKLESMQMTLVEEFELPTAYKGAIKGSNEDEMRAVAQILKDGLPKQETIVPDLHGGRRGDPVVPSTKSDGGLFLLDLQDNSAT